MIMLQEEFWRENERLGTDGWTWTLVVILLILICHFLRSRFHFSLRGPSSTSSTIPIPDAIPSIQNPGIICDLDLKNLIDSLDENSPDENMWEHVIDKSSNFVSYKAKCCKPQDGPLKYLSVTTFEDCSVEVLVKFYMDNQYRMQWDKTVVKHQQLQVDHASGTEIGRTIKRFPVLKPREYVLAWRLWQGMDGSFYCFSKECDHPLAPKERKYIRVAVFRSGWRIRKVPGRNACEIRMVHQEDAGLNLKMAKLAFANRIWSYVCTMDEALRNYHSLNSTAGATMYIQKVPPDLDLQVTNDVRSTVDSENSMETANRQLQTLKPRMGKLARRPSSKLITNGLVLLGGAVCLSRGHSSLGAKVAIAYMLSKLRKRAVSSKNARKLSSNRSS